MNENVIQLKTIESKTEYKIENQSENKFERFGVFRGESTPGEVKQKERVGSAFIKRGTKKFRVKLWLLPDVSYFVLPDKNDPRKYTVLIPESYQNSNGETRTSWRRVGRGQVCGTYIKIKIFLLSGELYLSMFPDTVNFSAGRLKSVA